MIVELTTSLKLVKSTETFDRAQRPALNIPNGVKYPSYYSKDLSNGVKIRGTKTSEVPVVKIVIRIGGGDLVSEDVKKVGVAELTAEMMSEGTQNYSAEQIKNELESLGSSIIFRASNNETQVTVTTFTNNLDRTLKLLEEELFHPRFDVVNFKEVKKERIRNLSWDRSFSFLVTEYLFKKLVYGDNIFGAYPSLKNTKKLTLEDVKYYYEHNYSPTVTRVGIAGDVSENEILPKLDFLNNWQPQNVIIPTQPKIAEPSSTQIYVAHIDFAKTSDIFMGYPFLISDTANEIFLSGIMNVPVDDSIQSRSNFELSEEEGVFYNNAYSYFSGSNNAGNYRIRLSVRRSETDYAVTDVMKILNNFKQRKINDEDIASIKYHLLDRGNFGYESLRSKADYLLWIAENDNPENFDMIRKNKIANITKEDLNPLVEKNIKPSNMIILVVGNKYAIKSKLEKLGYGKVIEVEMD